MLALRIFSGHSLMAVAISRVTPTVATTPVPVQVLLYAGFIHFSQYLVLTAAPAVAHRIWSA